MPDDRPPSAVHPLLEGFPPAVVDALIAAGIARDYAASETIVEAGSPGDSLYVILGGAVRVVTHDRTLATLATGEFFGEMCLIGSETRTARVVAVTPSRLFRIPSVTLLGMMESDPKVFSRVMLALVQALARRLLRMNELVGSQNELAAYLATVLV